MEDTPNSEKGAGKGTKRVTGYSAPEPKKTNWLVITAGVAAIVAVAAAYFYS